MEAKQETEIEEEERNASKQSGSCIYLLHNSFDQSKWAVWSGCLGWSEWSGWSMVMEVNSAKI